MKNLCTTNRDKTWGPLTTFYSWTSTKQCSPVWWNIPVTIIQTATQNDNDFSCLHIYYKLDLLLLISPALFFFCLCVVSARSVCLYQRMLIPKLGQFQWVFFLYCQLHSNRIRCDAQVNYHHIRYKVLQVESWANLFFNIFSFAVNTLKFLVPRKSSCKPNRSTQTNTWASNAFPLGTQQYLERSNTSIAVLFFDLSEYTRWLLALWSRWLKYRPGQKHKYNRGVVTIRF